MRNCASEFCGAALHGAPRPGHENYPTIRSRPVQKPAFSTFLSTLPTPVIGSSLTNLMCFGACAEPFFAFTRLISSSAFGLAPSRATTTAVTASPHLSSGTPTTATIATSACCDNTSSTSRGKMLKPPETIDRQLANELDVLWRVRRTLLRLHQIDQLVRIRLSAFARDDHGGDGLAPFIVGHADHGDHRDVGMLRQHILDLARKNVEAAGDD